MKKQKCIVCSVQFCKQCNIELTENHECKDEDKESLKLIKSSCKPCPKCHIPIFKIHGCDQMFCTKCHVPFSWNTGKIITGGFFHNPHYFDHLNNGGNNILDGPVQDDNGCQLISWNHNSIVSAKKHGLNDARIIQNLIRSVAHTYDVERARYRYDAYTDNYKVRYKYLTNQIDDKKYKSELYKYEKKAEKYENYELLYDNLARGISDILFRYQKKDFKPLVSMYHEIKNFIALVEESGDKMANDFKCVNLIRKYTDQQFRDLKQR